MGQVLLFLLMLFQETPLDQAHQLIANKDYFGAEGLLLSQDFEDSQILPVAQELAEIAFTIAGSPDQINTRRSFYQTYLSRSWAWRGISLFVLSAIATQQQQWEDLQNYGVLLLQEYPMTENPSRYRLLYHLARHTSISSKKIQLNPKEQLWFDACRQTEADNRFPNLAADSDIPFFFKYLSLLDRKQPFDLPDQPPTTDADRYLVFLLRIKQTLLASDLVTTSRTINEMAPLERELASSELRIHYYPLLQQFYTLWEKPDRADRLNANLELVRNRTVFLMAPDAERIKTLKTEKKPPAEPAEPVVAAHEPQPDTPKPERPKPENEKPKPEEPKTFEELEKRIHEDYRGLELAIRRMDPNTTYKKAYKNYLFGLYYLKAGRLDSVWDHLYLAERLATDYPFANLMTKILLAMGDYHQARGNEKDAEWRRIEAAQLWGMPEHMLFFSESEVPAPSPYRALIETALADPVSDKIHSLLYYAESDHFQQFRRLAFKHNVLTTNSVIGSQLNQVGGQLSRLITSLAQDPGSSSDASSYNTTLDLWNSLWQQVQDYYREKNVPSLRAIQQTLNSYDRILVFVEGYNRMGVVVISQNQTFVVGLGTRANYLKLSEDKQFEYLEGRLGPVWQQSGKLWIATSESFANESFVQNLRSRMSDTRNLGLLFSLESLTSSKSLRTCRNILVVGPHNDEKLKKMATALPQDRLTWLDMNQVNHDNLSKSIVDNDQVFLFGDFHFNEEGLSFKSGSVDFPLHQIVHLNAELCNLTLISPNFHSWVAAMPYLELISPDTATSFFLLASPDQYALVKGRRFGLHYP